MRIIEPHNDEDAKIWTALESFDFDAFKTNSELRANLYRKLVDGLGYCNLCSHFIKTKNRCKLLETSTGFHDRCSDFDRLGVEEKSSFEIMAEPFIEAQQQLTDAVKLNKYTKSSNKITPKTKEEPEETED